ncbi:MAG: transglutaminase domain-containing protein, partial [Nitrospirae bacterium]|nr:transglutaminase domain-containing protein [Nitrospirota bacterium]
MIEGREQKFKKAKEFLEKVKPPKKRIPLDPNKLPHRTPEVEKREPRTKPEQFLTELRAEVQKSRSAEVKGYQNILLASNGSLDGLLTPNSELITLNAITPTPNPQSPTPVLLAQATNLPTSADLAETIEVQFTPEITATAQELQNNPVKIYEYVRNNFEYEPYYGSLKGAQQTLLERAGNDFDQASFLIALLRASNIPARYVYGTVEIPIEKLMNWVGGVTDPNTAAQILATTGVPGKLLTEGGKIKYAQLEHIWVEAYVSYGNYRGALRDDKIKTWIPLDPSFKQYEYKRGMDLYAAMGINGEQYIQDYITDISPSPIPTELQDIFPDYSIGPYQYYSKRLLNYIDTNSPDLTVETIFGDETIALAKTIIKKEYPYLLGSLPYKVIIKGATYSTIPDDLRHKISFTVENTLTRQIDLSYNVTLPETAGKRITLSYIPASSADEALVVKYKGLLNVPPYLLNAKSVIKVDGVAASIGKPVGLGYDQIFNMSFRMPNKNNDVVSNKVTAGDYSSITIQYYKIPSDLVAEKMETLTNNISSTDLDDLLGQMLYNIGLSYMHHLNFEEELYAKNFQMIITKEPSEAIVTSQAITEYIWGAPYKVAEGGVAIDVDRNIYNPFSIDGSQQRKKDFLIVAGLGSSSWEDMIIQSFFNIPSVSAARLLKIANQQGIPIYTIDTGNINTIIPQLQTSQEVINNIKNAVNAGKKVIIPKTNVQYNDWNGVGYIILDPVIGSGAYLESVYKPSFFRRGRSFLSSFPVLCRCIETRDHFRSPLHQYFRFFGA